MKITATFKGPLVSQKVSKLDNFGVFDIYKKCRCRKTPQLSSLDNSCISYEHLKVAHIFTTFEPPACF